MPPFYTLRLFLLQTLPPTPKSTQTLIPSPIRPFFPLKAQRFSYLPLPTFQLATLTFGASLSFFLLSILLSPEGYNPFKFVATLPSLDTYKFQPGSLSATPSLIELFFYSI